MKKFDLSNIFNAKGKSARHKIINQFGLDKYDKRTFLNNLEELEKKAELGGERALIEKDCNFYDYDGTLLYSYTKEEALALTELPPLPTQPGLICQEWNYSLEDIIDNYGICDIGAIYITDNNKTRLYISIINKDCLTLSIVLGQTSEDVIEIDWGDGITQTIMTTHEEIYHTYEELGSYVISIYKENGDYVLGGTSSATRDKSKAIIGAVTAGYTNGAYRNMLNKVELGFGVEIADKCFFDCYNLKYITLNNTTLLSYKYALYDTGIKYLAIPKSITSLNTKIANSYLLEKISIHNKCTISYENFNNSPIKRLIIPKQTRGTLGDYPLLKQLIINNKTIIQINILRSLYLEELIYDIDSDITTISIHDTKLKTIKLPNKCITIQFRNCHWLDTIYLPKTIINLDSYFCHNCATRFIFFTEHEIIPTLSSKDSFNNGSFKVVVPDNLYNEWINATNWADVADRIIKVSDYESLNV